MMNTQTDGSMMAENGAPGTEARAESAFAPYKNASRQAYMRAKGIIRAHIVQCLLWAACYMLVIFATVISPLYIYLSPILWPRYFYWGKYALLPPLLLCLYGWLRWLMAGQRFAAKGFLDPFRWIKQRSLGKFLLIVLAGAAVLYSRDRIIDELSLLYGALALPEMYQNSMTLFWNAPSFLEAWIGQPLAFLPVFLPLTWTADFFFIHAAFSKGEGPAGVFHSAGLFKKILLAELRLAGPLLALPAAVFFGLTTALRLVPGIQAYTFVYNLTMLLVLLGFNLVYYARSAIARSLLILGQPRVEYVPAAPEPAILSEIDGVYRRERAEEARELGDQEEAAAKRDGE